jgi:hypothetical protein
MKALFKLTAAIGITVAAAAAGPRWAEVYRTGGLTLDPDPAFGRGVAWDTMLFDGFHDIAVAPDGSIFVANSHRDNIQKFDAAGKLLLTFGTSGQGPGDLQSPGSPGILDGKLLVVSEYASLHRISLFDLNGKFVKVLKTERPVFDVVPLRGNRVAYLSWTSIPAKGPRLFGVQSAPMEFKVAVKDAATGVERAVWKGAGSTEMIMLSTGGAIGFGGSMKGAPFIAATAEGDLAVGFSSCARIEIFSPQGEPVRRFELDIPVVPVRPENVDRYRKSVLGEGDREGTPKSLRDAVAKTDFTPFFAAAFPFYREMLVDSEGNFLFFLWDDEFGHGPIRIAAYSAQGRPIGRFELKPGEFEIPIDPRFRKMAFSSSGLIGLASLRNDPDGSPRLFRCRL